MADETRTPYLHLNHGADSAKNRNWDILDAAILARARAQFAGVPAGGDLTGFYPDPQIAPGAIHLADLAPDTLARLVPPVGAEGTVLTVVGGVAGWAPSTGGGPNLWQTAPGVIQTIDPTLNLRFPTTKGLTWDGTVSPSTITAATTGRITVAPGVGGDLLVKSDLTLASDQLLFNWQTAQPTPGTVLGQLLFATLNASGAYITATSATNNTPTDHSTNLTFSVSRGPGPPDDMLQIRSTGNVYFGQFTRVRIGDFTTGPRDTLDLLGGIVLGSTQALTTPVNGTLHWNGTTFQGRVAGAWVDIPGSASGGIPEAPTDGQLYGRQSSAWHVVPSGGGGASLWTDDPPNNVLLPVPPTRSLQLPLDGHVYFGSPLAGSPSVGSAGGGDLLLHAQDGTFFTFDMGGGTIGRWDLSSTGFLIGTALTVNGLITTADGVQLGQAFAPAPGVIQWSGVHFQGYTGTAWVNLDDTGGGGGGAPSGPAGGDLGGSYPNPSVTRLNGAVLGSMTPLIRGDLLIANSTPAIGRLALGVGGTVLTSNGLDAVWAAPASVPPSGPAGGGLTGSYPNPTLASNSVAGATIQAGALQPAKLNPAAVAGDVGKMVTIASTTAFAYVAVPASLPPSGAAGGGLAGTYPNPTINPAALPWTVSGSALQPTTATNILTLQGTQPVPMVWGGSNSVRCRLFQTSGQLMLMTNAQTSGAAPMDDASKAAWQYGIEGDAWVVNRAPPAATAAFTRTLTFDATGKLTLAGSIPAALQWGPRTVKGRLVAASTIDAVYLSENCTLNVGDAGWTQDDVSKPSWTLALWGSGDQFLVGHVPPGGTNAATLLALTGTGQVQIPGPTGAVDQSQVMLGSRTAKLHLQAIPGLEFHAVGSNTYWNGSAWIQDNVALPSWFLSFDLSANNMVLQSAPAGGVNASRMTVAANGDLAITGANATKSTGTVWINPSDPRLKKDIAPYLPGLAELIQLTPIAFAYNGKAGTEDGLRGIGLDASQVEPLFPECVSHSGVKLDPEDEADTDILMLDTSPLTMAMLNAIRELAARVTALEAR